MAWLPALLLLGLAARHLVLARGHGLSAGRGGGMAVFTTPDYAATRFWRCYLITDGGEHRVRVPGELRALQERLEVLPDPRGLTTLARRVAGASWSDHGPDLPPRARPAVADRPTQGATLQVRAARVELWRLEFDPATARLAASRWREATAERP